MLKVSVRNMESRAGNDIPNQFIIVTEDGDYFQSYQTLIAFRPNNKEEVFYKLNPKKSLSDLGLNNYPSVYLDKGKWNYSRTTGKYRNYYLSEDTAETRKKIKSGEYMLVDLN